LPIKQSQFLFKANSWFCTWVPRPMLDSSPDVSLDSEWEGTIRIQSKNIESKSFQNIGIEVSQLHYMESKSEIKL